MHERQYYGVFTPAGSWGLFTERRRAFRIARANRAYVMRAPIATFNGGTCFGIDAPTFRMQADLIADFRAPQTAPQSERGN